MRDIIIKPMTLAHLDGVYEVETDSFSIPWTRRSLEQEITENKVAVYIVAVQDSADSSDKSEHVVGYAGMWHVVTEGHITNIAVRPELRRLGIGRMLLERLVAIGYEKSMIGLTLEVRTGNRPAMGLYAKYGFKVEGYRKNYYTDTKEDAVVMWKYLN